MTTKNRKIELKNELKKVEDRLRSLQNKLENSQ